MATWQPPIPAGAMYSRAAVKIGVALPLLGWCYDAVQRDGTFEIRLKDAAEDMGVPYQTIRRWWREVCAGPFFAKVEDHGYRGYRVTFADPWIDWRILQKRPNPGPAEDPQPTAQHTEYIPVQGSLMDLEQTEGQLKVASRSRNGSDLNLQQTAYKEDIYTSVKDPLSPNGERARTTKKPPPASDHQALMAAYQEWLGYPIPNGGKEGAAARRLLRAGYTLAQIDAAYHELKARDFYSQKHLGLATVHEQIGALFAGHKRALDESLPPPPPIPAPDAPRRLSPKEAAARVRELAAAGRLNGGTDAPRTPI